MRTAITKSEHTRHQTPKPEDQLPNETWAGIARTEEAVLSAASEVVESVPAPVDVIDGALSFAAKTLKAQRQALVPLLERVIPKMATGRSVPTVADAVASALQEADIGPLVIPSNSASRLPLTGSKQPADVHDVAMVTYTRDHESSPPVGAGPA